MTNILFLIFAPLLFSLILPFTSVKIRDVLTIVFVAVLGLFSIEIFINAQTLSFSLPSYTHYIFTVLDFVLLLFFLNEGLKHKSTLVSIFAIIQIIVYVLVLQLSMGIHSSSFDIVSDSLSSTMYLVINIVGGAIVLYALKYIQTEKFSQLKKNSFIAILVFFLGVMNFIVSTNSIEVFFLLFELTTLCSYLLIKYRNDAEAIKNALQALWMNQIGGVAILFALVFSIYYYHTTYFDILALKVDESLLLPIVLLVVAAYVKGAVFPFHKWLLGAMVAPTPVSAILHSATMVKIAPFIVLKLASSFTPFISTVVSSFGMFVFLFASFLALQKDFIKEILGLSTIAILSLIIALAALNDPLATKAAILLLVFHAISKAMLFLGAGVLEKIYSLKYLNDINSLITKAPTLTYFLLLGLVSLTIPPFGAFVGKFLAIESLTKIISTNPFMIFALVCFILGSVVLTILYFKLTTKLLVKDEFNSFIEKKPLGYYAPIKLLGYLLIASIIYITNINFLSNIYLLVPFILIVATPFILLKLNFKSAIRVKEYNCGEKDKFDVASYYFTIDEEQFKNILLISIIFIILTVLGGV